MRARRIGLFVTLVAAASAMAPAAAWGVGWSVLSTPNPSMVPDGSLQGLSCTSASACTAVGNYRNSPSTEVASAWRWNGSRWSVESIPNPTGGSLASLSAVSCTSASACTAVGGYYNSGREATLAEVWDGSRWSVQSTPNPTGTSDSALSGVSCTSANACIAVGSSSLGPFAEAWDGSSWSTEPTPNPSGASLSAVSCTSASACTAVGSSNSGTLAERWNGSSWSVQTTPNPTGASSSELSGVSCTSASACTAVGNSSSGTFAESWSGTGWSIQSTPSPAGASLSAVSCTSESACSAVGSYFDSSNTQLTLAEVWNGSSWSTQSTPNPTGGSLPSLSAVSCGSASACMAVGGYFGASGLLTLAEAWNGSTWSINADSNPSTVAYSSLSGVSCTLAASCTAVGSYDETSSSEVTLAEVWDGTKWSIRSTPNPTAQHSFLAGVSCASASACAAVGAYVTSRFSGLAERWDGSTWSVQSTPTPSGALDNELFGVSCTSATACTAVGSYVGSGVNEATLAEAWDGSSWSVQSTPSPTSATNRLSGVSCTSASACTAVGNSSSGTLAEAWDGTSWSIQSTPSPAGASLSAVSCTSASACTAVGSSNSGTLAERWDGSSWSIQPTPNPVGASNSSLTGVSCTSASACTAVGSSSSGTLAEVWDGSSWSVQPTSNPSGASLSGVSCSSASDCMAAGQYHDGSGNLLTLAERYIAPTVTGVSPDAGAIGGGNTVTITGTSLQPGASVTFGTSASPSVTYVSPTELQAVVPAAASPGNVHVTVTESGVTSPRSNADLYAYTAISINHAAPVNEPANGSVSNATFTVSIPQAKQSPVSVDYRTADGTATAAANDYTPASGTATIPAGQTRAQINVQVDPGSGQSSSATKSFMVTLSNPSGAPLDPNASEATGVIELPQIHGRVNTAFSGAPTGAAGVKVGLSGTADTGQQVTATRTTDAAGSYSVFLDPGTYTVTPQPGGGQPQGEFSPVQCDGIASQERSGLSHCQIALGSGASATANFAHGPHIDSLDPSAAGPLGGGRITIDGSGFGPPGSADDVSFVDPKTGSLVAAKNVEVKSGTQITATIPAEPVSVAQNGGKAVVRVAVGTAFANQVGFTYRVTIDSIAPASGGTPLGGGRITITGSGFGPRGSADEVSFGDPGGHGSAAATHVQVRSENRITATIPAERPSVRAGGGRARVQVLVPAPAGAVASGTALYTYAPVPTAGRVRLQGTIASVTVRCAGSSGTSCAVMLSLTAIETIRGGRVIAVRPASDQGDTASVKKKTRKKLVVLGTARVTIPAGRQRTVRVSLNRVGRRLLGTRHKLKVRLKLRELGHTFATTTVTFKRAPAKQPRANA